MKCYVRMGESLVEGILLERFQDSDKAWRVRVGFIDKGSLLFTPEDVLVSVYDSGCGGIWGGTWELEQEEEEV